MQADADKLRAFLEKKNKNVICFSHAAQADAPILSGVVKKYGLAVGEGVVCESKQDKYYNQPYYTLAGEISGYLSDGMETSDPQILVAQSRPVITQDTADSSVKVQKLLSSSDNGYTADIAALVNNEFKVLDDSKQCYAAMGTNETNGSSVVLFGTSSIAEDQYSNRDMMLTLFGKLTGKEQTIKIEPKVIKESAFDITQGEKTVLKWLFILAVPLAAAVTGIVICVRRKRR